MPITAADVTQAIAATMDEYASLGPEQSFVEADIDSLSLVEAAVILTNRFGVRVDEYELAEAGTASATAQLIQSRLDALRRTPTIAAS
ncbi:acyl carrier protein [Sinomonas sp. ASV322]|uniref:acyl carrier protein n=1 Tax=Sinomonas sp. ASV322 TaxID=3041920 RepID=UPI0027DC94CB|nr:acyl carrier protein [Sinomonas sp. ASV322]MDQ4504032.1 acyl carrier protein [Sinomonas sp. ASV322]